MLFHCLILVCLGVFASCKPTTSPLPKGIREASRYLKYIMEKAPVRFQNENLKPVKIPAVLEEHCTLYNLDRFNQTLRVLKIGDVKDLAQAYDNLLSCLEAIAANDSLTKILQPQKGHQDCKTRLISTDKFLKELSHFLDELNGLILANK